MKKYLVHSKAVVLVLNKREAAAIAKSIAYLVEGKDTKNLRNKLIAALEEIGEKPYLYGLCEKED